MVLIGSKPEISKKPEIRLSFFFFFIIRCRKKTELSQVSLVKYQQVRALSIPDEGLIIHLKEFGFIKLLRKDFKKGDSRHYILYLPDSDKLENISRKEFITIHDTHWKIETFHRAIKQLCGVCRFMVRNTHAIQTHIFCSLQAFIRLEKMRSTHSISNWYQLQRNLFTLVIREYILSNLSDTLAT